MPYEAAFNSGTSISKTKPSVLELLTEVKN
jgi:hypothetical protein